MEICQVAEISNPPPIERRANFVDVKYGLDAGSIHFCFSFLKWTRAHRARLGYHPAFMTQAANAARKGPPQRVIAICFAGRNLIGDVGEIRQEQDALEQFPFARTADASVAVRGFHEAASIAIIEHDDGLPERRVRIHDVEGFEEDGAESRHDPPGR
jgi:DNA-binding transcriptional regulator YdaS (Cro superfamily)